MSGTLVLMAFNFFFFFPVFRLVGSHYIAAENVYRVQSHSVWQPQARGLLLARCSTISGQRQPHILYPPCPRLSAVAEGRDGKW